MISKILNLKRIGRFFAFGAGQNENLRFKKNTFIIGGNTHGKSTFAAVLRSARSGNPDYILGRKTFGANKSEQEATIELDSGDKLIYKNEAWNARLPIAFFDNKYISQNVFEGEKISTEQQGRIASIILGSDGASLEREYQKAKENCDKNSEEKRKITNQYKLTTEYRQITFEEFKSLNEDKGIGKKIEEATKSINTLKNQALIKTELQGVITKVQALSALSLEKKLNKTLEIKQDEINEHIDNHLQKKDGALAFFKLGVDFLKSDGQKDINCPFCSQVLGTGARGLIDSFNAYFSENYRELSGALRQAQQFLETWNVESFVISKMATLEKLGITIDFEKELQNLSEAVVLFKGELTKKVDLTYKIDFTGLNHACTAAKRIEEEADKFLKKFSAPRDIAAEKKLENDLTILKIQKKRFESPYKEICANYLKLDNEFKKELKPKAEAAFKAKVEYAAKIFKEYQASINDVLKKLGADFRLVDLEPNKKRTGSAELFGLEFFGAAHARVGLGDDNASHVFKNTLSDSDKRVLAFAFFVARLRHEEDLSKIIVVLDDPMSSFDIDRKRHTIKLLRDDLKGKNDKGINQLIVLTHEDSFFTLVHKYFPATETRYLRIAWLEAENTSIFAPCDINEEFLKEDYFKHIEDLKACLTGNDNELEALDLSKMRICLEHVLKRKYYVELEQEIKEGKSTTEFVKKLSELGIYDETDKKEIDDLLLHLSHHDQSNQVKASAMKPKEIRDTIQDFFQVLKKI
jgi:wobble nucleotide-excising tRNase